MPVFSMYTAACLPPSVAPTAIVTASCSLAAAINSICRIVANQRHDLTQPRLRQIGNEVDAGVFETLNDSFC